jgi:two-component system response regulator HydG
LAALNTKRAPVWIGSTGSVQRGGAPERAVSQTMPAFIILDGADAGKEIRLKPGSSVVIGRGEDAHVQLIDKNASRHHARLTWCEGQPTLFDLGSSNGSFVNGLPINQIALLDGDEVKLGEIRLRYVEVSGSTRKRPAAKGLRIGAATGTYRAVAPPDVTTQAFRVPDPAPGRMDALYDTYTKLKSLYRALQSFSSAKSTDELARIAADSILLAVPCDRVAIFLADERGKIFPACQEWREDIPENQRETHASVDADLFAEMARLRSPAFFYGAKEGREPNSGDLMENSSKLLGAPILEDNRVSVGMIVADTPISQRELQKNDLDLVGTLAQQMASPLARLRLIERLEQARSAPMEDPRSGLAIVTRSPAMQPVLQMIRQVAPTEATVLIRGESGTGKELLARAIHNLSNRRDQPLICVNCAALPETLIESELFGHEKGAFTGAFTRRPGKFEAADGGTIFLDEIGDLPPSAQSKLLRVLQEGEIQRLGSATPITVDARVIAATNAPLEKAIQEKKFREDLYYRIRVVEVVVPPLRDRYQDIPALAQYYLEFFRKKIPTPAKQIGAEAMQSMMHYRWPGNVRELRNVLERAMVLARDASINLADLPMEISQSAALGGSEPDLAVEAGADTRPSGVGKVASLADVEKRHIKAVLSIVEGNKVQAAKTLGISRTTLYEKIKLYELEN